MAASIPLALTLLRLFQGYIKINFWNLFNKDRQNGILNEIDFNDPLVDKKEKIRQAMTQTEQFAWLEKRILETVITVLKLVYS